MQRKIYVTGPVGGGKSTFSRKISEIYNYEHIEVDNMLYKKNVKKNIWELQTDKAIINNLNKALEKDKVVFDDVGNEKMKVIYDNIDLFIIICPTKSKRITRIFTRTLKRLLGVEEYGHDIDLSLKELISYNLKLVKLSLNYEQSLEKKRIDNYINENKSKHIVLKNNRMIRKYLKEEIL